MSHRPGFPLHLFLKQPQLPSLTLEQLWNHLGERGVFTPSPQTLRDCFEVLAHFCGALYYRLRENHLLIDPGEFFVEHFDEPDALQVMHTHFVAEDHVVLEYDTLDERQEQVSLAEFLAGGTRAAIAIALANEPPPQ